MADKKPFEIKSDDTDMENLINRGALHQIVKAAVAKLPPNITDIRVCMEGEKNSGFCKYIDINNKTHRLSVNTDEMQAFFKTIREAFKETEITGFKLDSVEDKTALVWAIQGNVTLVGDMPDD